MTRSSVDRAADDHTMFYGKIYHWTKNRKNKLTLHKGLRNKCKRQHRG